MVLTPAVPPVRPQEYSTDQLLQIASQATSHCQKSQASLLPKRLHSLAVSVLPQSHQDVEKLQLSRPMSARKLRHTGCQWQDRGRDPNATFT